MTETTAPAYPCPGCGATADLGRGCPSCGRAPDRDAAEVTRLDSVIAALTAQEMKARYAYATLTAELTRTRTRRDHLAARVQASVRPVPDAAPAVGTTPGTETPGLPGPRPEASVRGIQALLFVIGGVLLGAGAIVFTAVAWNTFGVAGRAAILAAVTMLTLAVPAVALWRGLRGTAETFAALGLLLVLLDGYAAWHVNLFGVTALAATTWAGLVAAGATAVAVGYAWSTRLTGPRLAGLALVQPVGPLLAVSWQPSRAGWAYLVVGLAAANLAVRWWLGRAAASAAVRVWSWVLTGGALTAAVAMSVTGLFASTTAAAGALAGGAVLGCAGVGAGIAVVTGSGTWRAVAAAGTVVAVALAAGRVVALAWPALALFGVAAVVAALVAAVAALAGRVGRQVRLGARTGAVIALAPVALYPCAVALAAGVDVVAQAWSWVEILAGRYDWQLPVAVALVTAATLVLVPTRWRAEVGAGGLVLVTLAVPPALALPWWTPVPADLAVAGGFGLAAVATRTGRRAGLLASAAAALAGHALLVGWGSTTASAAALGGWVLLGLAVAVRAQQLGPVDGGPVDGGPVDGGPVDGGASDAVAPDGGVSDAAPEAVAPDPAPARLLIGRVALAAGMLAWPGAVAATVSATGAPAPWPGRAAMVAAAVLLAVLALARRVAPGYLETGSAALHVVTPVAVIAGLTDGGLAAVAVPGLGVYAAVAALVLAAAGLLRTPRHRLGWLAVRAPVVLLVLATAAPQLAVALFGPYTWLGRIWTGAPSGVGVLASGGWPASAGNLAALILLAVAVGVAGRVLAGGWPAGAATALLVVPGALLVGLAQADTPWPVLPVVSLLLGAVALLAAALRVAGWPAAVTTGYGLVLAGAGLAGALPARWSTLAALGTMLAVAAVIGAAARVRGGRVAGWVAAVTFAVVLAIAATLVADAALRIAAFSVLVAAATALALGGFLRVRRAEAAALEAAGHAAAVVALLLSITSLPQAAVVAVLWGVAVGLRAMWPGEPAHGRYLRAVAAGGCELLAWWLLLASREVVTIEAYTLPAALIAVVVGGLVLRSRPEVGSWAGYGPALAAGFAPSLYTMMADPAPLRRLLTGIAAVAVVVAGARWRLQAPVVVCGGVALIIAGREVGLVWQLLDTWIPLTVAGLLLVGLAATYERRRRDLLRLRDALDRMT